MNRLNLEILAVFTTDEAKKQLATGSMRHDPMTPAQFTDMIKRESARWREVADKANIVLAD